MSEFTTWQRLAGPMPIVEQANASAALGIVAASPPAVHTVEQNRGSLLNPAFAEVVLRAALADAILPMQRPIPAVRWEEPVRLLRELRLFQPEPLRTWAHAWRDIVERADVAPRLRMGGLEHDEDRSSWIRHLAAAGPAVPSATLSLQPPSAQLVVRWPLRVATMAGTNAADMVKSVLSESWAAPITERMHVGRDQANSDALVYDGTAADLMRRIRDLRVSVKTNLIILARHAGMDDENTRRLLEMTHASGIVNVDESGLRRGFGGFLYTLSHNSPFDVALFHGFVREAKVHTDIALSDDLANLRGEDLARQINELAGRLRTAAAARSMEEAIPPLVVESLVWDHEHGAAREVAATSRRVTAALDRQPDAAPEQRFLQQRSLVADINGRMHAATRGFIVGRKAEVHVRIGRPDPNWDSHSEAFSPDLLPQDRDEWRVTVWLTEPTCAPHGIRRQMLLRRTGDTRPVTFSFMPEEGGPFDGRITVVHRGRVLQTAMLVARVQEFTDPATEDAAPRLDSVVEVRRQLGDLEYRREFDASFVFNKTTTGVPRMVALAKKHAWVTDLDAANAIVQNIFTSLSAVENAVTRYSKGLDDENGREFLVDLAREGRQLYTVLVKEQLDATSEHWSVSKAEYLQIVHTKPSGIVPLEFVYDHASPDKKAKVCSGWRKTLKARAAACSCDPDDRQIVCPLGFWGVRKVIERHVSSPALARFGGQAYVQSEPGRRTRQLKIGGAPLVAWSKNVEDQAVTPLLKTITQRFKATPACPANWAEWLQQVDVGRPRFLLAMPHTSKTSASAALEIGGTELESGDLSEKYLCLDPKAPPLVALLGCDTSSTADDYAPYVVGFREYGAAVIIATVATVFGNHAPTAADLLVNELLPDGNARSPRLGEVLRSVKQQALLDNLLMPLCLVAYGDADWQIAH